MAPQSQPLHVGILCDYGLPLRPQSGIGVFVYNLIEGLLVSQPALQITLLTGPHGQEEMQDLAKRYAPRIRILSSVGSPFLWTEYIRKVLRFAGFVCAGVKRWRDRLAGGLPHCVQTMPISPWVAPLTAGLGTAKRALRRTLERRVKPYGCNVWLVPFSGCKARLPAPAVLVIHDVVWKHFPDCLDLPSRLTMESVVPRRAAEATLCACMSRFVRDTDLLGVLGLAPEKVRLILPAVPADFPSVDPDTSERLRPAALTRPFLLYPAGFRSYKNHRTLVESLGVLRDVHGVEDLDLAFTGENEPPDDLLRLVAERGLQGRVHFLGCVERATLAALYHLAFATVLPSLYEQGSFPVYEALHEGCPVACSDIPPLREQFAVLGAAMLYFNPREPSSIARAVLRIRADRPGVIARQQAASRPLWQRTWVDAAEDWVETFREAMVIDRWQKHGVDRKLLEPWPRAVPLPACPRDDRRGVFLFLQVAYAGGVWETTKELVRELVALNRERGGLRLTLGIHEDQGDTHSLERLGDALRLTRLRLNPIHRSEVQRMVGGVPAWLASRSEHEFCFFSGAARTALQADAWLALVDRFPLPLLPARPYGVMVHDMIQRAVPEAFDAVFFRSMKVGMQPTLDAADLVLVTSPQTRRDAIAEYGLDPDRVALVPLACDPQHRFGGLTPVTVGAAHPPFLLNTSNLSRHKGIEVLLRGFARLKARLGTQCPQLVVCGVGTDRFSARAVAPQDLPECLTVRRLVGEQGLEEDHDVVFLGLVSDAELLDLYQRCEAVVNAALYDNGSFLLTEGAFFGRRCVSSRYAAAEYLCERFQVPARFFPASDPDALAITLEESLRQPPPTPAQVEHVRARFQAAEFSVRSYAERVYDALVDLAKPPQGQPIRRADRVCA